MNARSKNRKVARQQRIIALLRANPSVRISELARDFGVSSETVRRDLDELGEAGAVNRTYGGAVRSPMGPEATVSARLQERVSERQSIALMASEIAEPGEVIMIDGGSTTIHLARQLAARSCRVTVLTNCLGVAEALGHDSSSRIVLCPGDYNANEAIVTGPETLAFLDRFFVDRVFFGASGLTVDGPSEAFSGAAWVKRRMLGRAKRSYLLVDSGKFNVAHHELVCPLNEIDVLVTDDRPDGALHAKLVSAGVDVMVVPD